MINIYKFRYSRVKCYAKQYYRQIIVVINSVFVVAIKTKQIPTQKRIKTYLKIGDKICLQRDFQIIICYLRFAFDISSKTRCAHRQNLDG